MFSRLFTPVFFVGLAILLVMSPLVHIGATDPAFIAKQRKLLDQYAVLRQQAAENRTERAEILSNEITGLITQLAQKAPTAASG